MRNSVLNVTRLRGQPLSLPIAHLVTDHATEVKHCFFRHSECRSQPCGWKPLPNRLSAVESGGGPAPRIVHGAYRECIFGAAAHFTRENELMLRSGVEVCTTSIILSPLRRRSRTLSWPTLPGLRLPSM